MMGGNGKPAEPTIPVHEVGRGLDTRTQGGCQQVLNIDPGADTGVVVPQTSQCRDGGSFKPRDESGSCKDGDVPTAQSVSGVVARDDVQSHKTTAMRSPS